MNVAFLCLGGNIGNRLLTLKKAIKLISAEIGCVISQSNFYETEAWGIENQDNYLNQCICIETNLSSNELLKELQFIELDLGRRRNLNKIYEARTIDIDILFYNSDIIDTNNLIIPHPRLHLRKFVLVPLKEIATDFIHPILKKTVNELLVECVDNGNVLIYK